MSKREKFMETWLYTGALINTVMLIALCACTPESKFTRLPDTFPAKTLDKSKDGDGYSAPLRETYTQTFAFAKYDVLWVVDNSGSMEDEAAYVRDNIDTFVQTVHSRRIIDYQMAVTNTDWLDTVWGHGQLRGSTPIIRSTDADPVAEFQNAVNDIKMCSQGACSASNGYEMGLGSARQALTDHPTLIRDQSNLVVVILSDEQDYSCTPAPGNAALHCEVGAQAAEDTPGWNYTPVDELATYFKTVKPSGSGRLVYFPIVGVHLADCTTFATIGQRYLDVLTGIGSGAAGSICQNAMQSSLDAVAGAIADNGVCFTLSHAPVVSSLELYVNSTLWSRGYTYDSAKNSVCFDIAQIPANGSAIDIKYLRQ